MVTSATPHDVRGSVVTLHDLRGFDRRPNNPDGMHVAALPGMTRDYPVQVEVTSPARFERSQVLLRIVLSIVLGWIGITAGWLTCLLFGTLPVIAALAITSTSSQRYQTEVAPKVWRVLRWLLGLSAFMHMLVDRFPTEHDDDLRFDIRFTGHPTALSALKRLLTSIPSGLVLGLVWIVSGVLAVIAALLVLLGGPMPQSILAFQRGRLRWEARLVAYHASLVEEYPPFSLDTEDIHDETLAASGAP